MVCVQTALNLTKLHGIESAGSSESLLDTCMISTNDKYKVLYEIACMFYGVFFPPMSFFFLLIFYYDSDSVVIVYSCFYL